MEGAEQGTAPPPLNACKRCGQPARRGMYCSPLCAATASNEAKRKPPKPCAYCGQPVKLQKNTYCSNKCSQARRKITGRPCAVCGKEIGRKNWLCCSMECMKEHWKTKTADTVKPPTGHSPELIEQIRALRERGVSNVEITKLVGLTKDQLKRIYTKQGIKFNKRAYETRQRVSPPVKRKVPGSGYTHRIKVEVKRVTGQPIHIPLREVYRYGADLGLPRSKRGDIAAVSAAWKKANPGHPGFVLGTYHPSRTNLYT